MKFPKGKLHKGLSSFKVAAASHSSQCGSHAWQRKMPKCLLAFFPQRKQQEAEDLLEGVSSFQCHWKQ